MQANLWPQHNGARIDSDCKHLKLRAKLSKVKNILILFFLVFSEPVLSKLAFPNLAVMLIKQPGPASPALQSMMRSSRV